MHVRKVQRHIGGIYTAERRVLLFWSVAYFGAFAAIETAVRSSPRWAEACGGSAYETSLDADRLLVGFLFTCVSLYSATRSAQAGAAAVVVDPPARCAAPRMPPGRA